MPNIRWLLALITSVHRFLYRASGGFLGHRAPGYRFLLLANRGRKSGREYLTPLLYVYDGDFVVVGSNAGDPREPSWWANLREHPDTWVQVGRERLRVRARAATDAEVARLWPRVVAVYGSFERYRERAGRPIPLVLLERRGEARYAGATR
jgi:deazaflavin-dependent oxidoreductase (nitroreductase family)